MIKAVYQYKVKIYDISSALNKIKENKIKIYKLKKISDYEYTFYSSKYKLYPNSLSLIISAAFFEEIMFLSFISVTSFKDINWLFVKEYSFSN